MNGHPFDFQREVVDLSFEKPVLIDFWAPWCGPCKILGPVLEELERESGGRWALVKINTEDEQEIAAYFRIQSIPHCKLVFEGKIVGEFTGAQSKTTIGKWLEEHFASMDLVEEVEAQVDDFESLIQGQEQFPDRKLAEQLELFISGNPGHNQAIMTLARHEVFFDPAKAIARLNPAKDQKEIAEQLEDMEVVSEWMEQDFKEDHPAARQLLQARKDYLENRTTEAMEAIIELVHHHPKYQNELPRRLGIALFHLMGNQHPVTREYRKWFDMAVY